MTARSSHFKGSFHIVLASDIGEIEVERILMFVKLFAGIDFYGIEQPSIGQKINNIGHRLHTIYIKIVDHCRLAHILFGHDQALEMFGASPYSNRQSTFDGLQFTVKSQLTHHHILAEMCRFKTRIGRKDGHSKRQIKATSFFPEICRSHIHSDICYRKAVAIVLHSSCNTIATFANSLVS